MTLNNIKQMKNQKGFTIVELLIVIVIIGILAALVIVAYNGIQNRAKTTSQNAAASTLVKKIEAFNSVTGGYPTTSPLSTALNGQTESSLTGSGITIDATVFSASNLPADDELNVTRCGHSGTATAPANLAGITATTGWRVGSWDYSTSAVKFSDAGQVSGNVGTFPVACFLTS